MLPVSLRLPLLTTSLLCVTPCSPVKALACSHSRSPNPFRSVAFALSVIQCQGLPTSLYMQPTGRSPGVWSHAKWGRKPHGFGLGWKGLRLHKNVKDGKSVFLHCIPWLLLFCIDNIVTSQIDNKKSNVLLGFRVWNYLLVLYSWNFLSP